MRLTLCSTLNFLIVLQIDMAKLRPLLKRLDIVLRYFESTLPSTQKTLDWQTTLACRWLKTTHCPQGELQAVKHPHHIALSDLQNVETQKQLIVNNTVQFLRGYPANNVLLWGSRGTGKSSLIKAVLNEYHHEGLRFIEIEKHDLIDLPIIVEQISNETYRFILFCDDLSFEAEDASYKALKSVLDGSISAPPNNVLIYATSNRRHLLPEYLKENQESRLVEGEIHHSDAVEEKISLSERFGLWVSFYPFSQTHYLAIAKHWIKAMGLNEFDEQEMQTAALQWALQRGSRSGRCAWQFARDWVGQQLMENGK